MSNFFTLSILMVFITGLGIFAPKFLIHSTTKASETDAVCSQHSVNRLIFDNGIQQILTTDLAIKDRNQLSIDGKTRTLVYTNGYTLFGLKYVTLGSICNPQTGELICASKAYQLLESNKIDPEQPCG